MTMLDGSTKKSRTHKNLCMGCGKYFPTQAVIVVEGVHFCKDCKEAAEEFRQTVQAERDAFQEDDSLLSPPLDKWERAWSSSEMVSITQERLNRLPHPIPLTDIEARLMQRLLSRALDFFFVAFALFVLDVALHLTVVTGLVFGELGLEPGDYQYPNLLDPSGWTILTSNPQVLRKVGLFAVLLLGLYRLFFYLIARRTLGQSFAGVMLATPGGRYPGLGSRFVKGLVSTLSDAVLIGPLLDLVFYSVTKPKVTLSDAVANLRAVRYEEWKKGARNLIHRTSITRIGGSPTQESLAARKRAERLDGQ